MPCNDVRFVEGYPSFDSVSEVVETEVGVTFEVLNDCVVLKTSDIL